MFRKSKVDVSKLSISDDAKDQLMLLLQRHQSMLISKKELSVEIGISCSSIDNHISTGIGVPRYKKLGTAKNSKVVFNLIDVAEFLADRIEML